MADSNDKIHALPGRELPENLMSVEPRRPGEAYFCAHDAVRLNQHDRIVNCARCGATLDPFNFLLNNAVTIQRAWENYRAANLKVGELNDRVATLSKEEKRLRAQVKRLQDKTGDVIVGRTHQQF